ncbi:MAG: hypothetical protein VW518_10015 [Burkholderiaceae bacterium]
MAKVSEAPYGMIKHKPIFKTDAITEHYSKKDGVPVKYVCTSALGSEAQDMDIFYRETPHPEFGNRYFGMFIDLQDRVMITNADKIDGASFAMIEDNDGNLHYSAHRHDYKEVDGKMIDGGRAYIRTNCDVVMYEVRDGEFVVHS